MNILVIGGGGREHTLVWKLKQSPKTEKVYCLPGNAGIAQLAQCDFNIKATDFEGILSFLSRHQDIGLVVVAPDDPLSLGLVNILTEKGYRVFGPDKEAAIIEGSKVFSKNLMKKYAIPTAKYETFSSYDAAVHYAESCNFPLVVKADGLALGKGVIICEDFPQAKQALGVIMLENKFGNAGKTVVIEEFLTGREVSVLCFTDGKTVLPMASSQDHKRALTGDKGENTGGMGTFSPSAFYTKELAEKAYREVLLPTVNAMNSEGRPFKGVLYFGLMIEGTDINVLEYNARFGDPEAQVVLPRLKNDLVDVMNAVIDERLHEVELEWLDDSCVCVIAASGGYPQQYEKGIPIEIGKIDSDIMLFHSGTAFDGEGKLVTAGGRVIGVTAMGKDIDSARDKAYKNMEKIKFDGMHYRTDIGYKL